MNADLPFAKKSLGQHWLTDVTSLQAMVTAAGVTATDTVLEIGPGVGTLTRLLVEQAHKVVAVEFDERLAHALPQQVPAENLAVVHSDILKYDLTQLPTGYKVAANIPYYLTSKLLRILCESTSPPAQMALLVQKEVAERVAAAPGEMSLLSVSVQFYCDVKLCQQVPAALFTPPPKVDSQILQLVYRGPKFADADTKQFFRIVKAGFANRRKTIVNSLSAGLHLGKSEATELLMRSGIAPQARPQELSLQSWYQLYQKARQPN